VTAGFNADDLPIQTEFDPVTTYNAPMTRLDADTMHNTMSNTKNYSKMPCERLPHHYSATCVDPSKLNDSPKKRAKSV
jgi:hypothetical protein